MNRTLKDDLFKIFVSICGGLAIYILYNFNANMKHMQESINDLNINFASFSEKLVNNERERQEIKEDVREIRNEIKEIIRGKK